MKKYDGFWEIDAVHSYGYKEGGGCCTMWFKITSDSLIVKTQFSIGGKHGTKALEAILSHRLDWKCKDEYLLWAKLTEDCWINGRIEKSLIKQLEEVARWEKPEERPIPPPNLVHLGGGLYGLVVKRR